MKRILITGANSYIGMSFENYVADVADFEIDTIDMIDGTWKEYDFSKYDVVFHVAGIAHADVGNVTEEQKKLYYKVNTDLTIDVANKAKQEGVKQFIFMSSMIVYSGCKENKITKDTEPNPENFYGDSKWQADKAIQELNDDGFKVVVLRPPMIYGKNSKGNYPVLAKMASKLPIFPVVKNQRSMLYVGNLCEFIKLVIENEDRGVFFPQNAEYTKTSNMVKMIANAKGHRIFMIPGFNWAITLMKKLGGKIGGLANKAFGDSYYDMSMSEYKTDYRKFSLKESIDLTEKDDIQKKALILASVASMIDQFNMQNIQLLLENGYEVDVMCNCKEGNTISDERIQSLIERLADMNVPVIHVPIPRKITDVKGIINSLQQVKKQCEDKKYTLLHCHSPIGSVVARLAAKASRKKFGTKVIYTAHGFHFYKGAPKQNWLIFYPIEKFCSRFTDVLITINKEDYAFAQQHMKAGKVEYIPGIGVDTKKFKLNDFDKDSKKAELGISVNDIMILSVGELNENKNQEVVVKAIAKLDNKENIHYFIAGKGDKEEYLNDLAKDLNVNLHLLGYRTDIIELLNTADIFAFPSFREGLSVALMEAMAAGLPCVVSDIRGNVDLICFEDISLCNPSNVDDFSNVVLSLINSNSLRSDIGLKNVNKIMDFDVEKIMSKTKKIYIDGCD